MNKRTTMRICNQFKNVYFCKYADLQYILPKRYFEPDYYNVGTFGWNCDLYILGDTIITTGYRNLRGERIPEEIIRKYSKKGNEIDKKYHRDYEKRLNEYWKNFQNMVDEINRLNNQ